MEIRKVDRSAPRCTRRKFSLLCQDNNKTKFGNHFLMKYPKYKGIPHKAIYKIISTFSKEMINAAIENRDGIELPANLGYCFIGSCPCPKKFNTDQRKSAELGIKVRHWNFETDNNLAKIFYTNYNKKTMFLFRDMWLFYPCKKFRKATSIAYLKDWKKYIQVESYKHISSLYRENISMNRKKTKKSIVPQQYNEFDL